MMGDRLSMPIVLAGPTITGCAPGICREEVTLRRTLYETRALLAGEDSDVVDRFESNLKKK